MPQFELTRRGTLRGVCASVLTGVTMLAGLSAPSTSATAAQIKLDAELGQPVIVSGKAGRVYLRINLEGIALPSDAERTPVNVALVIDRSGSMNGPKLVQARKAAIMALNRLDNGDMLSVVTYNHDVEVVVPSGPLKGRVGLRDRIERIRAKGRTALYAGTRAGINQVREYLDKDRVNRVILLSDGLANVGPSTPDALGRLGREAVDDGISITTIGLGLGYNEDLMAKLAYNSDGNHAFVENAGDLVKIFDSEFGDVLSVVAQEIIIQIECREGFRPRRVLGREARIENNRIKLKVNQLYGKQQKYVVVELDAPDNADAGSAVVADVRVRYRSLTSNKNEEITRRVSARFTQSAEEAKASTNKRVMTAVATQIANETSERALTLRDKGKIKEASRLLSDNAAYLSREAAAYGSKALQDLSVQNRNDAAAVTRQHDWNKSRKAMRANQHKQKVQQRY